MTYYSLEQTYSRVSKIVYYLLIGILTFIVIFLTNVQHKAYNNYIKKVAMFDNETISHASLMSTIINYRHENHDTTKPTKSSDSNMKYILLWTNDNLSPFIYFGKGQSVFINEKCQWTNCYVTSDRNYLGSYTEFDVIVFNGPQLPIVQNIKDVPSKRLAHQKYVYGNIEAANNYPIVTDIWNGFFNWTWTYKLNSDATWGYVVVRNSKNEVIGPKIDMHWININDMDPINDTFKTMLRGKKKAAAWFCSNCYTTSKRESYVRKIQNEMRIYNLELDIYGSCGPYKCPKERSERCLELLRQNYYFYFAFENALSEDYVTEKIVDALNYDTVPVVYGSANYTRFMPEGIYLNSLELGPSKLAKEMNNIISNPELYYRFFKWKKYYSFHKKNESPDTNDYCQFCAMLNNHRLVKLYSTYKRIDMWWNPNNKVFNKEDELIKNKKMKLKY